MATLVRIQQYIVIICVYRDIIILVLFIQISIFNEPHERNP